MSVIAESRCPTLTLQITKFPAELLDQLDEMAKSIMPRTTRNGLIEWVLCEFAAGRLVPADDRPATAMGKGAE